MKQLITILMIFQVSGIFAQFDFQNDEKFEFSHTEYLCISSEIGLDTVTKDNEFEIRVWMTKPENRKKNLFRLYKPFNDSLIHAQMYEMTIREKFDCVGLIMEPLIPDPYLYSIDLQLILKNLAVIRQGRPEFCIGIDRKKAKKYLKKEGIANIKKADLNELHDSILLNLPPQLYKACNENLFNYIPKASKGFIYTIELLKPNKARDFVFNSPLNYPKSIVKNDKDLERFNLVLKEIYRLLSSLRIEIVDE